MRHSILRLVPSPGSWEGFGARISYGTITGTENVRLTLKGGNVEAVLKGPEKGGGVPSSP